MKTLKVVLLVGLLVPLAASAARTQDEEKPKDGRTPQQAEKPNDSDRPGPRSEPGPGRRPSERGDRKPVADLAAETASHEELKPLAIEFERLTALRLQHDGNLLAGDAEAKQIKVISPQGELVATIQLEFGPEAIDVAPDGTIFCGGQGRLAKLDKDGNVLKTAEVPKKEVSYTESSGEEDEKDGEKDHDDHEKESEKNDAEEKEAQEEGAETDAGDKEDADKEDSEKQSAGEQNAEKEGSETDKEGSDRADRRPLLRRPGGPPDFIRRRRRMSRSQQVSGIAVCGEDLFVASGSGWSLGSKSKLFRLDLELEHPTLLAEGLRGCCQRCDIAAWDGVLYLAENAAHRVVTYNREGEVLGKWGERSRNDLEGFGSCCNPMNLCFDAQGVLYTAESGMARVKRYSTDGKFVGLVGYVGTERFRNAGRTASSCSNIAIAVTPGGECVYVMDFKQNLIRVLQEKPPPAEVKADKDEKEQLVDLGAESASHKEVDPLGVEFGRLAALRMQSDGNLLACDAEANQIKVIDPEGEQVDTIKLEFAPEAIDVAADGTIYCGGEGQLAKLNPSGEVIQTGQIPEKAESSEEEKKRAKSPKRRISGIAVSDEVLFVAFGAGGGRGSRSQLFRFDLKLQKATPIAEDLHACCQRCDVVAQDGIFYLAENTAHRIVRYDAQGNVLGKWGQQSRTELQGFGSCCNPMNLCFGPEGVLYTAESGMARVKRYTPEGKFLGLVGYVGTERFRRASGLAASCSNIAIAVSPHGRRVYVMDSKNNSIRVLQQKD